MCSFIVNWHVLGSHLPGKVILLCSLVGCLRQVWLYIQNVETFFMSPQSLGHVCRFVLVCPFIHTSTYVSQNLLCEPLHLLSGGSSSNIYISQVFMYRGVWKKAELPLFQSWNPVCSCDHLLPDRSGRTLHICSGITFFEGQDFCMRTGTKIVCPKAPFVIWWIVSLFSMLDHQQQMGIKGQVFLKHFVQEMHLTLLVSFKVNNSKVQKHFNIDTVLLYTV